MNKFDERYEIRLAKYDDIEMIMQFLDEHWRKDHIMAKDRCLFEYEYVDGDNVNFVLAIDRGTRLLEGIFGFINCSKTEIPASKDIWGSMWKVVDTRENMPFLGIELAKRVHDLTGCRAHIGNGANPKTTIPLRKMFFKESVGKMQHYYLLNPEIEAYKIAAIKEKYEHKILSNKETNLVKFDTFDELQKKFDIEKLNTIPYKDNWYLNKRYFEHPYYTYEVYGLKEETDEIKAVLICREVKCNGSKVLRIMDYLGEESSFSGLGTVLKSLLKERNLEYIDFYVYGFETQYIEDAGFTINNHTENIIPNYFEPFSQTNVDIWVHHKLPNVKFFKADGDQDRPNKLRGESKC